MTQPSASSPPSPFDLSRLTMGLWVPQAVHAAAELGVADAVAAGASTAAEVAAALGTHPGATARLLDALCVLGLVRREGERIALAPLGAFLRSDHPHSRRAWARLMGSGAVWRAWGQLAECVRTGEPAYTPGERRARETETFDALFERPDDAEVFHRAMADGTRSVAGQVVAALELEGARTVGDVGGGSGELLCAALEAHPGLEGFVADLAHARPGAASLFERRGLAQRARFVEVDLFEAAPPRADVLLLKSVVHDWDDARALAILHRCREALAPGGRLVVVEPPAHPAAFAGEHAWIVTFSDLNMLVNTGGRERTADDYRALVERAGLRLDHVAGAGFYACFVCSPAA